MDKDRTEDRGADSQPPDPDFENRETSPSGKSPVIMSQPKPIDTVEETVEELMEQQDTVGQPTGEQVTKRDRKQTEKGAEYQKTLKFNARKVAMNRLKRLSREIESDIDRDTDDIGELRQKHSEWLALYEKFLEANDTYMGLLSDVERNEDAENFFLQTDSEFARIKTKVEQFFASPKFRTEIPNPILTKKGKGSISKLSSRSGRTNVSDAVMKAKLREHQKKVELKVRSDALLKRHELELERVQLQLKEEKFVLDTEMKVSDARTEALDDLIANELQLEQQLDLEHEEQELSDSKQGDDYEAGEELGFAIKARLPWSEPANESNSIDATDQVRVNTAAPVQAGIAIGGQTHGHANTTASVQTGAFGVRQSQTHGHANTTASVQTGAFGVRQSQTHGHVNTTASVQTGAFGVRQSQTHGHVNTTASVQTGAFGVRQSETQSRVNTTSGFVRPGVATLVPSSTPAPPVQSVYNPVNVAPPTSTSTPTDINANIPRLYPSIDRSSTQTPLNYNAREFVPSTPLNRRVTFSTGNDVISPSQSQESSSNQGLSTSMSDVAVLNVVREMRKPTVEIQKFSGDPLQYTGFMRQFESRILVNTEFDDEKLNYLLQYTSGEANKVVAGYSNLEASLGFYAAMNELKERYGDPELIVHSYVSKALEWPSIKADSPKSLDEFAVFLTEIHYAAQNLQALRILEYSENMKCLVAKLPYFLHDKWRNIVYNTKSKNQTVSFWQLVNFVRTESKKAVDPTYGRSVLAKTQAVSQKPGIAKTSSRQKKGYTQRSSYATEVSDGSANSSNSKTRSAFCKPCLFCGEGVNHTHSLNVCRSLASKDIKIRYDFLKKKGLCFSCLSGDGHLSRDCKRKAVCSTCNQNHPLVLHIGQTDKKGSGYKSKQTATKGTQCSEELCASTGAGGEAKVAVSILPVRLKVAGSDSYINTWAFIDGGSTASFVSQRVMKDLKVEGRETKIHLRTLGNETWTNCQIVHGLEVSDIDGEHSTVLPGLYSQELLPVSQIVTPEIVKRWPYLQHVPIEQLDGHDHEIGLLIGTNVPKLLEPWDVVRSQGNGPYAVKTVLGWVINGPLLDPDSSVNHKDGVSVNQIDVVNSKLEQMMLKQYNFDFNERSPDVPEMSVEDRLFLDKVENSVKHTEGHYSIKLPFRQEIVSLPNNRPLAQQRCNLLKRRLVKDKVFYEQYRTYMNKIVDKGYASLVSDSNKPGPEGKVWYLPHHGVFHPVKQKIRVVFDCAARYRGTSLNENLLQGPNLTNSLVGVLLRFRQDGIAFVADIEEMFYQVRVPPEDRSYLRFLWWKDGDIDKELVEFELGVQLFGANSSPACCNFALRKTALDNSGNFNSEVIDVVLKNFYVDDCLKAKKCEPDGADSVIALIEDLQSVCSKGGFHIRQFISNNRDVMNAIPETERSKNVVDLNLEVDQLPLEHALGVQWNVESDTFGFRVVLKDRPPTRRGILSMVSSIYDPLGFLAPFIIRAKCLLQELCKLRLEWDAKIPEHHLNLWLRWLEELQELSSFTVDRCVKPDNFGELASAQLHHFSDASEVAYGVASVIRLEDIEGNVHCSLILGKARVTPLKSITIPRLELTAATLAVRVDNMIRKELDIPVDKSLFWSDSMAVLRYIANVTTRFQTFVANRLTVIRESTEPSQWRYISSKQNPADIASRGVKAKELIRSREWFAGPEFLSKPTSEWPERPLTMTEAIPNDDPEVKHVVMASAIVEDQTSPLDRLIAYHSSWFNLKLSVAWILKIKKELLRRARLRLDSERVHAATQIEPGMKESSASRVTVQDLREAENVVLQHVQKRAFGDELATLGKGLPNVKSTSALRKLTPVMVGGLLCVGGRLSRANVPHGFKNPIILPKNHHVSELILSEVHAQVMHMGRNHVLSTLREKYWLIHAPSAIRRLISKCVPCRKQREAPGEQKMSDLPGDRVVPDEPPFTTTGCDYFGPFHVRERRSTVKRYGVLFTCLTCRAVHIEVADSLDTSSCINALRRFLAHRGQVRKIRSDNGSNFLGSDRELRDSIAAWNLDQIHSFLLQKGIEWEYNPPAGSHHGGIWERMIRSVRQVLNSVAREQVLTNESLQTLMCEAEAVLNSRPITRNSDDPSDLEVLTPNHLLLLKTSPSLPPGVFQKEDNYPRRRWRQVQYLSNLFWQRWLREYLPLLQVRQKWLRPKRNLSIDDVVLVVDSKLPRNSWLLGRVTETFPDRQGFVRQVRVQTKAGVLLRPIDKLCLLLECDE